MLEVKTGENTLRVQIMKAILKGNKKKETGVLAPSRD